ncbi:hypothetical protein [Novipirellula rosea]|uniref:Uncharacterized protein n=1 Tax=Novipirellula rosea TaxID=1031540 RepID=A0ABP8MQC5_9BACT
MDDFDLLRESWDDTEGVDSALLDSVAERVLKCHRKLKSTLDGRDAREVGVCVFLIFVFGFYVWLFNQFYIRVGSLIVVAACVEVSAVLLWARRGLRVAPDELSVRDFTEHQRTLVRRQIRLLRNIAWWYLLPFFIGLMVMTYGFGNLLLLIGFGIATLVMYWVIWRMNQRAIADELGPLDEAYTMMLEAIDNPDRDMAQETLQTVPEMKRANYRSFMIQIICLTFFIVILSGFLTWLDREAVDYPKLAPFTGVRWQDERPQIEIDDRWYELVAIDGVKASEIVEYCEWRYLGLSHKRFEEDLVEVLTRMGHPLGETSELTLKVPSSDSTVVLDDVPWTAENRTAIKQQNDGVLPPK